MAESKTAAAKAEAKEIKVKAKAKAEPEAEIVESAAPEVKPAELKLVDVKVAEVKIPEAKPKPANKRPNAYPTEGFALEIDGKVKSEHTTLESAHERGMALKIKYPVLRVVVYDASNKARTLLELPA